MRHGRAHLTGIIFLALSFHILSLWVCAEAHALSVEEERAMGREFLTEIKKHFELIEDNFADGYINELGQYITKSVETKFFPFHFYIIKHHALNAFAGPGGHVFLFSGLIEEMDCADELVAVISHEAAHVSARHLSHRIERGKRIGIATMAGMLAGILIGGTAAKALVTGSAAAGVQAQLGYSRDDERQADQLGFKYAANAGFDPKGMLTVLKKIQKGGWLGSSKIPPYLRTHPSGPERMSNIDTLLSAYKTIPPKGESERFRRLFPFFKTVVRATSLEPHEAERQFMLDLAEGELKEDSRAALSHFGLGIVYKEMSELDLAIQHLRKALKKEPDFVPILANLGEAYQMNGQDREAIRVLDKARELDSSDRTTIFLLGVSYENLHQYRRAVRLFERLISLKPVNKEVYYHLGLSYGRQNRLGLAHYNFGLYFKELGEKKKARFHFRKAEELSRENPALEKRIRQAMEEMG